MCSYYLPFIMIVSPSWKQKIIATAARKAFWLLDGTYCAVSAASTMRVAVQHHKPTAVSLFRGTRSIIGIAMMLSPRVNVSQADG